MKNKFLIAVIVLIVISIPTYFLFFSAPESESASGEKQLYTCGMHPQIISEEPGLCPICEMNLTPVNNGNSSLKNSSERKVLYYRNPMNPEIISETPQKDNMGMDYIPVYDDEVNNTGIVTIDPQVQQNMNVKIENVDIRDLPASITTNGIVQTDETNEYIVNTKADGWIEKLYINYTGQEVKKNAKLMDIYSPMLISAQQEFLTALSYQSNIKKSSINELLSSGNDLVKNAVKKLQLLDLPNEDIERLKETKEIKQYITLYSKYSGTVLEKFVIEGQKIMAGEPLLKMADLSNLWVTADIYEYELSKIKVGSKAYINFNYLPEKHYEGTVSFIYPTIDKDSRTVKVRVNINNSSGSIKPAMFATVAIDGPEIKSAIVIPENAVIRSGKKDIVILSLGGGKFKPQEVKLGIFSDGYYQVVNGLQKGNSIVTSAQFLIDSESNLKAAINQFTASSKPAEKKEMTRHSHENSNINENTIDVSSFDKNKDGKVWECPMDWDFISDNGGRCPVCNMYLKEYTIDEVKMNLKKHGFEYK